MKTNETARDKAGHHSPIAHRNNTVGDARVGAALEIKMAGAAGGMMYKVENAIPYLEARRAYMLRSSKCDAPPVSSRWALRVVGGEKRLSSRP